MSVININGSERNQEVRGLMQQSPQHESEGNLGDIGNQQMMNSISVDKAVSWRKIVLIGPRDDKESIEEIDMLRFEKQGETAEYPTTRIKNGLIYDMKTSKNIDNPKIDVAICVTLYNEGIDDLIRTLTGICKNIEQFSKLNKNIVVIFIFDGIDKVNSSIIDFLNDIQVIRKQQFDQLIKDFNSKSKKLPQRAAYTYTNYVHQELIQHNLEKQLKIVEEQLSTSKGFCDSLKKQFPPWKQYQLKKQKEEIEQKIKRKNTIIQDIGQFNSNDSDINGKIQKIAELYEFTPEEQEYVVTIIKSNKVEKEEYEELLKNFEEVGGREKIQKIAEEFNQQNSNLIKYQQSYLKKNSKQLLQTILCIKVKNAGKLSSHHWFLQGFCPYINPKYCFLVDCGTYPEKGSLFRMYSALEADKQIGGVCGYMGVLLGDIQANKVLEKLDEQKQKEDKEKSKKEEQEKKLEQKAKEKLLQKLNRTQTIIYYLDYLVALLLKELPSKFFIGIIQVLQFLFGKLINAENAQLFEYTMSHIMDKGFESFFGFISVLPGAFSAYRWQAINNVNLLEEYLQLVLNPYKAESTCEQANKYLAEDRIMCLSIFTRRRQNFILKYLPTATAVTDVPKTIVELIKQRRRWNNGSWFATLYVIQNAGKISSSSHGVVRRIFFRIQILFQILQIGITYILVGLYYSIMTITIKSEATAVQLKFLNYMYPEQYPAKEEQYLISNNAIYWSDILINIFLVLIVFQLFLSLQYKLNNAFAIKWFQITTFLLGIYVLLSYYFMYSYLASYFITGKDQIFSSEMPVMAMLIFTVFFSHALPCIFYPRKAPVNLILGLVSYIFYSPTFIITMILYSFCNFDDVSWGNREDGADQAARRRAKEENFKNYKMKQFSIWAFFNVLVVLAIELSAKYSDSSNGQEVIKALAYFTAGYSLMRGVLSFLYHVKYYTYDMLKMIVLPRK